MSSKIDERIVAMRFDNGQFEKGIAQTSGSLGELKRALDMGTIADGVSNISNKFSAFGAIAFSAINNVVGMALNAGMQMANSLWDPLVEGGKKRSLAIEQAKFQFANLGMDIQGTMDAALYAVKGTAFGLDEAASAAANLGASRVPLERMGQSLRAISGVAALAGSSYSDIADVFSKVAGQGRLMGDDLNRLAARGVNAAATLGAQMGITEGEVRELVSEGGVSFEMFAAAMDNAFGANATKASETFAGAASNMRAALSRIGAAFATPDFEAQRLIFNAFTPAIDNIAKALTPVVELFTDLVNTRATGLVTILDALNFSEVPDQLPPFFQGLQNVFTFLRDIAHQVKAALSDIFPPTTADSIKSIAATFLRFTESLRVGDETATQIRSTFRGLFAIIDIVRLVVVNLLKGFFSLFEGIDMGGASFLKITAAIGEWLVRLRDAIRDGDFFVKVFDKIRGAIDWVVSGFKKLMNTMFGGLAGAEFKNPFENVQVDMEGFLGFLGTIGGWVKTALGKIGEAIQGAFAGLTFDGILNLISTGLFGGILVTVGVFIKKITDSFGNIGGGLLDSISGAFDQLTDTLKSMQLKVKADVLLKIAIAVGILAASLIALAFVEPERLSSALAGMTVMFIQLISAMIAMEKYTSGKGLVKMGVLTGVLIGLAAAMVIFAAAVSILAALDWNELARGMAGMAVGLGLLVGAMLILDKMKNVPAGAGSILVIAGALLVLAVSLKIMASVSWGELATGMVALTGILATIIGVMTLLDKMKNGPKGAATLLALSGSLFVISTALKILADLSWDEIARGLTAFAGVMAGLVGAMLLLDLIKNAPVGALTMIALSVAVTILAKALAAMGELTWEEIGRGLTAMAGSLAILAGAMALMGIPIVLLGSIGILAAAAAMFVLAPALKIMGTMSWDEIGRGMALLGSTLAILAVGGLLMIPASVGFFLLGAAILAIGGGILMAAKGLLIFSVAITALAAAAAIGAEGIKMAVTTLFELIPLGMAKFGEGIIAFAEVISSGGVAFIEAGKTLILSFLTAINETAPEIINTIWLLITSLVAKVVEGAPLFMDAAWFLLLSFMDKLNQNLPALIALGTAIVIKLIEGIGASANAIITAAAETVLKFLNGIAAGIDRYSGQFSAAGRRIFTAIVEGVSSAIENGGSLLAWAGQRIGNAIIEGAKNALGINSPSKVFRDEIMGSVYEGLEDGNDKNIARASTAGKAIGDGMLYAAKKSIESIRDAVATDMNLQPTIRPIIDLSAVRQGASDINGLILQKPSLSVDSQYAAASAVAVQTRENRDAENEARYSTGAPVTRDFKFEQHLHSPTALSRIEIYRQSQNLYAAAKEALDKDD